ncbi:hypothetical protein PVAND_002488 [Polypedilum vanderplanki]|uniref:Lipase domain-containing protein n=1 Tax=Polypedilum vanderplanki TaxID=319348 RepID=A0A9J6BSB3_POLVA|nr:hypothetical protein PVAND_002488 [Polypedilum vanderplanki]
MSAINLKVLLILLLSINISNSLFWDLFSNRRYGITYKLFTRQNPLIGQYIFYSNPKSLMRSYFNNARPTRMIIHGVGQNENSSMNIILTKSYLTRGDFNVIVVDWSTVASPIYQYARLKVNMIGMAVSKYITWLNPNYNTLHVIGYDLGAHIAGIAGKNTVNGRIGRIIGLDPSLPLFSENLSINRLNSGDAQLVEVFHSNGGRLGIFSRMGQLDYYINNGRQQPECASSTDASCSHYRAVTVFSNLVSKNHKYLVIPCMTIDEIANKCSLDPIEILLEEISPSGIYQVSTDSAEPLNVNEATDP